MRADMALSSPKAKRFRALSWRQPVVKRDRFC